MMTDTQVGYWALVTVEPEDAQRFLDTAAPNRRIRLLRIERFATDMTNGSWRLTHQGLAFDTDGCLIDGQHRLLAQIRAGLTMRWWVYHGLSRTSSAYIDHGAVRSDADAAKFLGIDANGKDLAIARLLITGPAQSFTVTRDQLLDVAQRHHDAIAFAQQYHDCFTGASVRAPVARAYYSQHRPRLQEFLRVLTDGISSGPEDSGAVRLRTLLTLSAQSSMSRQTREGVYKKTERALVAFLQKEPITKIYDAPKEMFLIEDDGDGYSYQKKYLPPK